MPFPPRYDGHLCCGARYGKSQCEYRNSHATSTSLRSTWPCASLLLPKADSTRGTVTIHQVSEVMTHTCDLSVVRSIDTDILIILQLCQPLVTSASTHSQHWYANANQICCVCTLVYRLCGLDDLDDDTRTESNVRPVFHRELRH